VKALLSEDQDFMRPLVQIVLQEQPAQLAQAVVVDLARHVVEGIPEKGHVTALPYGFRQHLEDRDVLLAEGGDAAF
jgi:hypothetical protein